MPAETSLTLTDSRQSTKSSGRSPRGWPPCCNDYKPRIGETSYRCIIRDGWNVLLQPIGDYQPTRGERDC